MCSTLIFRRLTNKILTLCSVYCVANKCATFLKVSMYGVTRESINDKIENKTKRKKEKKKKKESKTTKRKEEKQLRCKVFKRVFSCVPT